MSIDKLSLQLTGIIYDEFRETFIAAVKEALNEPEPIKEPEPEKPQPVDPQKLKRYLIEYLRRKRLVMKNHDQLYIHLPGNPEYELTEVMLEFIELYENDFKTTK
jgi:hypothetical protein